LFEKLVSHRFGVVGLSPTIDAACQHDMNLEWQVLAHFVATLLGGIDHDDDDDDVLEGS
jgi:hypothetical protein